ncbi:MAG: hypothetical protein KF772_02090 [Cryobacterium sp.]|nr:hypothetical protein [Cryobacterium sp.]
MGIAMALTGLSSAWYMVGLGRPRLIVVYELSPRILATLLASLVLVQSGQAIWYPIALIGAGLVGTLLFLGRTVGFSEIARRRRGEVARTLRKNLSVMATEVIGGAYNSLAVSLVSIGSVPSQAAAYVSGDKLYRIGQYSVSALGNAMQGWVVEDSRVHFAERARRSLVLHLSLGTLGLFAFATVGPWLSGLLFGEIVRIDFMTALGLGIATFNIALGTAVGRVILIGLGARRQFLISVIVGASVGIPSILVLATLFGAPGGAWGLATGELASVTCQSIFAILEWRRSGVKVLD